MPIIMPDPPADVVAAFLNGVEDFLWTRPDAVNELLSNVSSVRGLQLCTLTLDQVLQETVHPQPRNAGWRIFALLPSFALAGDVSIKDGAPPQLTSLSHGPEVKTVINQALAVLERNEFTAGNNWRIQLLRIPSTYIEACWLVEEGTNIGLYVPIIPGLDGLQVAELYPENTVFRLARDFGKGMLDPNSMP